MTDTSTTTDTTANPRAIADAAQALLDTLQRTVPSTTVHYLVEEARDAATRLLRESGNVLTVDAKAIRDLPNDPEHQDDPRWTYTELTKEQAYRAWPCGSCNTRRDEHADQKLQHTYSAFDITDHAFVDTLNAEQVSV